jgi:protein involved in polysaccharide export with SLBB domain
VSEYRPILWLFFCLALLLIVDRAPAQSPTPAGSEDRVHLGDVVDVDIVGGFEFDWRGKLNPDGYLDSLVGMTEPILGLCRTEKEIAADVAKGYSNILREPVVVVRIIDRSSRAPARLDGAVRTPTRFRLLRPVSLRELLVLAGGLTDAASGEITIFRPANLSCSNRTDLNKDPEKSGNGPGDNGSQTTNIKISELITGNDAADPQILSGDIITVTRAAPFYVIGAVNNPRPIYSHTEMTVSRAVASAGGPSRDADPTRISIYRRVGDETQVIGVDLIKVKRGDSKDEVLRQFDIVEVASKGGAKRKYPPLAVSEGILGRAQTELPLRVIE